MSEFWKGVLDGARTSIDEIEKALDRAGLVEKLDTNAYIKDLENEINGLSRALDAAHGTIKLLMNGEFVKAVTTKPAELSFLRDYEVLITQGSGAPGRDRATIIELRKMDT